jgi:hypothetical protein
MRWMRTLLDTPSDWTAEDGRGGRRVIRVPGAAAWGKADLVLEVFGLVPLPDPVSAVIAPFVGRELPPGTRLETTRTADTETMLGAPMVLVEARVVGTDGEVVEERIAALYQFLEYGGRVMVRSRNASLLAEKKGEILAALKTGRADFTGQVAAISQLFAGFPEDSSWGC